MGKHIYENIFSILTLFTALTLKWTSCASVCIHFPPRAVILADWPLVLDDNEYDNYAMTDSEGNSLEVPWDPCNVNSTCLEIEGKKVNVEAHGFFGEKSVSWSPRP